MVNRPHFQRLVQRARPLPPLRAAFVYPCDASTLQLVVASAFAGFLDPVLVGPEARVRDIATQANLDVSRFRTCDSPDTPRGAAEQAIALARDGEVSALVKGSLGLDELMGPLAQPNSGLRTARRLSHAHIVDMPSRAQPMLLADAMLNLQPSLAAKRDIVLNTLDLAHAAGLAPQRVALVAGIGMVQPAITSTTDAEALVAMGTQGVFGGVPVEGPLLSDAALGDPPFGPSPRPMEPTGVSILIGSAMEPSSVLLRAITALTGAVAAGVVLGARVPIIAPLRSDLMEARIASCVLASLYSQWLTRSRAAERKVAAVLETAPAT
jgi:phosphotransacetylase